MKEETSKTLKQQVQYFIDNFDDFVDNDNVVCDFYSIEDFWQCDVTDMPENAAQFLKENEILIENVTPSYGPLVNSFEYRGDDVSYNQVCVLKFSRGEDVVYYKIAGWYASYHGYELEKDNCGFCTPVQITYTDFSIEK